MLNWGQSGDFFTSWLRRCGLTVVCGAEGFGCNVKAFQKDPTSSMEFDIFQHLFRVYDTNLGGYYDHVGQILESVIALA